VNAERLEIARRLVACKGWAWLPGMRAIGRWENLEITEWNSREAGRCPDGGFPLGIWHDVAAEWGWIPDLDDDLTRLGVLAVVRQAWSSRFAGTGQEWCDGIGDTGRWSCYVVGVEFNGDTEDAALLAAMEAAPQ
jgi:hypothetical protein